MRSSITIKDEKVIVTIFVNGSSKKDTVPSIITQPYVIINERVYYSYLEYGFPEPDKEGLS